MSRPRIALQPLCALSVFALASIGAAQCELEKLVSGDGGTNEFLGWSASVTPVVALLGAPYDDDLGIRSGSAYLFEPASPGPGWVQTAELQASDGGPDDLFGQSVSISGDTALVGAPYLFSVNERGSVYVFTRGGGGWIETQKLLASDGAARG